MVRRTELYPTSAVCREAIALFAEHLTKCTHLRPRLVAGGPADVLFEDESDEASLSIEWDRAAVPEDDLFEEWEDAAAPEESGDDRDDDPDRRTIEFYAATMEALARNPDAAQRLLRRLKA